MTQQKPQKTDNLGWIFALLFPKKSGGPTKPATAASAQPSSSAALPVSPPTSTTKLSSDSSRPDGYRPTLWTIASILSLIVNVILLLVVIGLLVVLKPLVGDHLLGGLYNNFVLMDQANIQTTITVQDQIPIKFDLPVVTNTNVVLTEATYIEGALVTLNTGGLYIANAPANIVLPAGTSLPVSLNIVVPVEQQIPITLQVPVNIPLSQTELHDPFVGLRKVVEPFYVLFYPDAGKP